MQVLTSLEGFKETKRKRGPRSLESQRSRISPSLLRFGRPEGETVRRRLGVQRTQALPLALVFTNKPRFPVLQPHLPYLSSEGDAWVYSISGFFFNTQNFAQMHY